MSNREEDRKSHSLMKKDFDLHEPSIFKKKSHGYFKEIDEIKNTIELRYMGTPDVKAAIFKKGNNSVNFLFASL